MILFTGLLAGMALAEQGSTPGKMPDFSIVLPAQIMGWQRADGVQKFTPQTLYEYINGGAELFISYGFREAMAYDYTKTGEIEIKVDIFDMGNPYDAFGVFRHGCESLDRTVAPDVESQYSGGLLTFWKGQYYVSLLAYPETPEKRKILLALAGKIADAIDQDNPIPPIVDRLPKRHLLPESIRYFTSHVWLNSHYFISDENLLGIGPGTPATLARYRLGTDPRTYPILLIIGYPDPVTSEEARRKLSKKYGLNVRGLAQERGNKWIAVRREGRLLAVVLGAPDRERATSLLSGIVL